MIGVLNAQINSLEIINPKVEQGDTVVIRINPQWQGSQVCVSVFGKQYMTRDGYALVGIGVDIKPDKYPVFRVECGRGFQLDPYPVLLEVTKKNFIKTRTARIGRPNAKRKDSEAKDLDRAYGYSNRSNQDSTNGVKFIYPVDTLYSGDQSFITHNYGNIYRNNNRLFHSGIDIKIPIGTSVKAVNRGQVVLVAKNYRQEGKVIIINHGLGIFSVYMHLSRINVNEGDIVEREYQIGLSGDTGTARGNPHLHWNMMVLDLFSDIKLRYLGYVDPLIFVETANQILN